MRNLTTCKQERNSNPLPLFEVAEQQRKFTHPPLLITGRLARRFKASVTTLNAWAAANGFTCEGEHNDH